MMLTVIIQAILRIIEFVKERSKHGVIQEILRDETQ